MMSTFAPGRSASSCISSLPPAGEGEERKVRDMGRSGKQLLKNSMRGTLWSEMVGRDDVESHLSFPNAGAPIPEAILKSTPILLPATKIGVLENGQS